MYWKSTFHLFVAIYDLRNDNVLKALKSMSGKVTLRILFYAGKPGGKSKSVDPKPSKTAQAIKSHGLVAQPVKEKGGHLMHDKFIVSILKNSLDVIPPSTPPPSSPPPPHDNIRGAEYFE